MTEPKPDPRYIHVLLHTQHGFRLRDAAHYNVPNPTVFDWREEHSTPPVSSNAWFLRRYYVHVQTELQRDPNFRVEELVFSGHGGLNSIGGYGNVNQLDMAVLLLHELVALQWQGIPLPKRIVFNGCDIFKEASASYLLAMLEFAKEQGIQIVGSTCPVTGWIDPSGAFHERGDYVQLAPSGIILRDVKEHQQTPLPVQSMEKEETFKTPSGWNDRFLYKTIEELKEMVRTEKQEMVAIARTFLRDAASGKATPSALEEALRPYPGTSFAISQPPSHLMLYAADGTGLWVSATSVTEISREEVTSRQIQYDRTCTAWKQRLAPSGLKLIESTRGRFKLLDLSGTVNDTDFVTLDTNADGVLSPADIQNFEKLLAPALKAKEKAHAKQETGNETPDHGLPTPAPDRQRERVPG